MRLDFAQEPELSITLEEALKDFSNVFLKPMRKHLRKRILVMQKKENYAQSLLQRKEKEKIDKTRQEHEWVNSLFGNSRCLDKGDQVECAMPSGSSLPGEILSYTPGHSTSYYELS